MKKMRIIVALTCVLALGLVFTGCSCTKSSTTNSTSSQSASNSSGNSSSKDANSTNGTDDKSNASSTTDATNANGSSSAATSNVDSALIGTWKYDNGNLSYKFNSDGTGVVNLAGVKEVAFTYSTSNGKISMNVPESPQSAVENCDYTVDGNNLVVKTPPTETHLTKVQ